MKRRRYVFLAGANSIFMGDRLLTTPNPEANMDRQLFDKLGMRLMPADVQVPCLMAVASRLQERLADIDQAGLAAKAAAAVVESTSARTTTWGWRIISA